MKQTSGFISTYSADAFGVCSALYELGGMIVMHDASGCNSTYTTHDEPRWYDMDSMVYISGLTEVEAIMGDDSKLINDVVTAAEELNPKFIAIVGTTIPAMTGFDADAAAKVIEERTGIPAFGFSTTGMKSYVHGASLAFEMLADRFVKEPDNKSLQEKVNFDVYAENQNKKTCTNTGANSDENTNRNIDRSTVSVTKQKINILGLTPLDFSVNGSDRSIKEYYESKGYEILSSWAMGSTLEDIKKAAEADLNIVVSETGIKAAKKLKEKYGIPYKIGIPVGGIDIDVTEEYETKGEKNNNKNNNNDEKFSPNNLLEEQRNNTEQTTKILILGERVNVLSLAKYLHEKTGKTCLGYATTDSDEDEIIKVISSLDELQMIIADPLFKPVIKLAAKQNGKVNTEKIKFVDYPHEAFSGRIYRKDIPNIVEDVPFKRFV
ncbi:MAG: oxidoreductase [Lachnospiraceae bacterium]|nr:oxidoreductase [Lachnospiraceae bacterium]